MNSVTSRIPEERTKAVDDDIAVRNFREYLRINTAHPNPNYAKCTEFLYSLIDGMSFERSIHECVSGKPFIMMTLRGRNQSLPSLMLYSHTDVVPAPDKECWKFDPFAGVKDVDGKIYGRGSQDTKSIGIQYVEAMRHLFNKGQRNFLRTIHIVWGPDEELGGTDGMEKFANDAAFSKLNVGFVLDEGLATDDEAYKVYYADRCPWWIIISCGGNVGHGSQFIENTAAEKMRKIVNSFMDFREQQKKLLQTNEHLKLGDVITVNLTKIEGGIQMNVLPSTIKVLICLVQGLLPLSLYASGNKCCVLGDGSNSGILLRKCNLELSKALEKQIQKWCLDAGTDVTYTFIKDTRIKAMTPITDNDPWWHAFSSVFKDLNYPISVEIFPGATDSRFLRQKGIRSLGFSPINKTPVLFHAHNEFITEDGFLRGITIYEKLIEKLANLPG